jgi:uncharacterized protein YndB with AHSA1/START domain
MIQKILFSLVIVVAILLIVVATRPADFRVERSATIAATPDALFEQVNNHRNFQKWSPWDKMDPTVKNTYSGPDSGVGSACSWVGDKIGEGTATIIESKPGELVRERMDWRKPMQGTSTVEFTFQPQGDKTVVTWAMYGKNDFMGKFISLFMNCDKMCGPQFEKGLADLAKIVATPPAR